MRRATNAIKLLCSAIIVLMFMALGTLPCRAEEKEDKLTALLTVDFLNQYVLRGVAYSSGSLVIQPSVTFGYKGFSANVWGNFDTGEKLFSGHERWNDTDYTLSYGREICRGLTATVGAVYYALVNSPKDSTEIFAGLTYALPWFQIGLTGYREFHNFPGWWMQVDVSRNFRLPCHGMSLDLGMSVGYLDSNVQEFADWHSAQMTAALNVPVGRMVTISPRVGFAFPITADGRDNIRSCSWDSKANHLFGGVRIAASF